MSNDEDLTVEWNQLTEERYELSVEYGKFTRLMFEHRTDPELYNKYLNELAALEAKTLINKNRMKEIIKLRGSE